MTAIPIALAPSRNATAPAAGGTNDSPTTAFHCSADWHLIRLGKYAAPIHALMLRVQDDDFFGSVEQVAEYFRADDRTIRGTVHEMVRLGFVLKVTSRDGESTIYRALTHKEWAKKYPGRCAVKRDALGQGHITFNADPSQPVGGVGVQNPASGGQNVTPQNGPLPMNGRQVSEQSPKKFPKDIDTRVQQKDAATLAAIEGFNSFCQEMEEQSAFDMVLWILYRAASVRSGAQIPQSVDYYRKAKDNLINQHEHDWELVTESAEAKFCKRAYRLVEANSPDLLDWLKEKARQLAEGKQTAAAANA